MTKHDGRIEVFRALVGSHNYNLSTPESDKDYKVFVLPTFDDLYDGKEYSHSIVGEEQDLDIHDIRKIPSLFYKSNINFIETLYSTKLLIEPNYMTFVIELYRMKEELVTMNLPYLFNACFGMHYNKIKLLYKGTEGTQHLVDKYGYDCYSEDTLFLTNNGWKNYDNVMSDDLLATVNPITHSIEYQNYFDKVKKNYTGVMYELDNVFTNCLVTSNHRMFVSEVKQRNEYGAKYRSDVSNWVFQSMESLIKGKRSFYHVLNTPKNTNKNMMIDNDYLQLVGLYVSEGTIQKRNGKLKSVRITQTHKGKQEFFEVMDSISDKFEFKKYNYDKETVWISSNKELIYRLVNECDCLSNNVHLPYWIYKLSKEQSNLLIYSLFLGDGTIKRVNEKEYGLVYYTINKKLAQDVQHLAILAEKDSLLWGGDDGYNSISSYTNKELKMFQVYIKNNEWSPKVANFKPYNSNGEGYSKGIKEVEYNGNVVCFSVPNENLITQRNGKVAIQGNTKQAQHANRCLDFLIRFANTGFKDFTKAMRYEGQEKEEMLAIKNGKYSSEQFTELMHEKRRFVGENFRDVYQSQPVNEQAYDALKDLIKSLVKSQLTNKI